MKTIDIFKLSQKEVRERFTIEYCPWCDSEQIIFAHGTTECPDCKHILYPCSVCYDETGGCENNKPCPYGIENRVATNIPLILTEKEIAFLYKNL